MSKSPGPSKTIPAPLPFKLEDPSTERSHTWGVPSSEGDVVTIQEQKS